MRPRRLRRVVSPLVSPRPSRRGVLGGLAGVAALAPLGLTPGVLRADEGPADDQYFIFCYFQGGWDLQMCLDPRDPALFRDDLRKVTRIQPGWDQLSSRYREMVETSVEGMTFGPAIGGLARHAERLCVVRGISMDTLTHEVGRRRFLTGHPPVGLQARGSSLATVLASRMGASEPMPQLSVLVESYNDGEPSWSSAIRVSSVDDLLRALEPAPDALSPELQALADGFLQDQVACERRQTAFHADALAFRRSAQGLVSQGLDARFDFGADTTEMSALRDLYGIDPGELSSAATQGAAAVTAITSGISRCVSIVVTDGLDSHGPEWATAHAPRLESGFDVVASILDDLASREHESGDSWLDHTTVVVFSEFGRSPLLNSSGGRDHYLHNAAVLAGGGVRGGQVLGRSSDFGMAPTPTDLQTGLPSEGGVTLRPEHLFRAIIDHHGLEPDAGDFDVRPLSAIYG